MNLLTESTTFSIYVFWSHSIVVIFPTVQVGVSMTQDTFCFKNLKSQDV